MENSDTSISKVSQLHSITSDFLADQLKQKGLPEFVSSHGNILFQLSQTPQMTMKELSAKINRNKSTTTVLIRKLEEAGLVQETPDTRDKRNKFISLTQKGREYNDSTKEISKTLLSTFYKGFTEEEKKEFTEYLERICRNFE